MAAARREKSRRAVVELDRKHIRFVDSLIETVRGRTGVVLDATDVIRAVLDQVVGNDMHDADVEAACAKVQTLSMLLDTRRAIEREIRQTEADLHQTLVHGADGAGTVKIFRRNLRYQTSRLESLDEQTGQLCNSNGGRGDVAFRLVQALLSAPCEGDGSGGGVLRLPRRRPRHSTLRAGACKKH